MWYILQGVACYQLSALFYGLGDAFVDRAFIARLQPVPGRGNVFAAETNKAVEFSDGKMERWPWVAI